MPCPVRSRAKSRNTPSIRVFQVSSIFAAASLFCAIAAACTFIAIVVFAIFIVASPPLSSRCSSRLPPPSQFAAIFGFLRFVARFALLFEYCSQKLVRSAPAVIPIDGVDTRRQYPRPRPHESRGIIVEHRRTRRNDRHGPRASPRRLRESRRVTRGGPNARDPPHPYPASRAPRVRTRHRANRTLEPDARRSRCRRPPDRFPTVAIDARRRLECARRGSSSTRTAAVANRAGAIERLYRRSSANARGARDAVTRSAHSRNPSRLGLIGVESFGARLACLAA